MNLIKEHIEYLKNNPEGYWFKRKLYGFGWTPAKPAGWLVLIVYLVGILCLVWYGERTGFVSTSPREFVLMIIALTVLFLVIVWRTGEPPKWQWGNKVSDDK